MTVSVRPTEPYFIFHGIKHLTSATYYPISNALGKRAVQIIKTSPQSTTGISPSELLLGRHPLSRLDLLKPNTTERVESNQQKQEDRHDQRCRERNFAVGDGVQNYHQGDQWLPGRVIEQKNWSCFISLQIVK